MCSTTRAKASDASALPNAVGRGYAPDGFFRRSLPCSLGARLHDPPKSRRGRSPDLRSAALLELSAAAALPRRVALGSVRAAPRPAPIWSAAGGGRGCHYVYVS